MRHVRFALSVLLSSFFLSQGCAQQPTSGPVAFVLGVDRQGSYFSAVDGAPLDEAAVAARAVTALRLGEVLVVEADADAPYQRVVRAAELLQQSGATKISFRTP